MLEKHRGSGDALYADHLTLAALMTYYAPDHPSVRIPTPTRFSQYDMWDDGSPYVPGLYLSSEPREKELSVRFGIVTLVDTLTLQRGLHGTKTYYLYRVAGPVTH